MPLEKYHKKRKFEKTSEPQGSVKSVKSESRFVVQEHHVRNLHWDFRLELPEEWESGSIVLKSWAVPKGVPEKSGIKHLAIQTEDHPVEYLSFQGEIPKGQYGGGTVSIWDEGKFKNYELRIMNHEVKEITLELAGKKLKGEYVMIKTNFAGNKDSWLIFRK